MISSVELRSASCGGNDRGGQVAFRWPSEHVRATVPRLGKADGVQGADLSVDEAACSVHCHAYAATDASKVKKINSIRQSLRMRGFQCNLVYTRACTHLNVIPLSASRPRALRYLSIQWGIDLSKVAVLIDEKGDTDSERLLPGLHRTLIMPGMVARGSKELLRDEDGFTTEDVVPWTPQTSSLSLKARLPLTSSRPSESCSAPIFCSS